MDRPLDVVIDDERMEAGKAYLDALRKLGLDPEGLVWAWDRVDENLVLMLVTRYFDIVGPSALSTLLFRAYNLAITPTEIDPFIVRIFSPDHMLIRNVTTAMDDFKTQVVDRGGLGHEEEMESAHLGAGSFVIPIGRAYVWKDVRRPKDDLLRRWGIIKKRVDAIAA